MKIVLTGTGRVGQGAEEVLLDMGIRKVEAKAFLEQEFDEAVFTQLICSDYVARKDGTAFSKKETADYSAITTWGVFYPDEDSPANLILLDAFKETEFFIINSSRGLVLLKL